MYALRRVGFDLPCRVRQNVRRHLQRRRKRRLCRDGEKGEQGDTSRRRVRRRRLCRRLVRQRAKNGRKIRFRQGNHGGRDVVGKVCKHGFQSELRPQLSRLSKSLDGGFYQGRGRNSRVRAAESGLQISRLERRQRNLRRRLGLRRVGEPLEGRGLFGALGDGDRFGGVFGRHGLCF